MQTPDKENSITRSSSYQTSETFYAQRITDFYRTTNTTTGTMATSRSGKEFTYGPSLRIRTYDEGTVDNGVQCVNHAGATRDFISWGTISPAGQDLFYRVLDDKRTEFVPDDDGGVFIGNPCIPLDICREETGVRLSGTPPGRKILLSDGESACERKHGLEKSPAIVSAIKRYVEMKSGEAQMGKEMLVCKVGCGCVRSCSICEMCRNHCYHFATLHVSDHARFNSKSWYRKRPQWMLDEKKFSKQETLERKAARSRKEERNAHIGISMLPETQSFISKLCNEGALNLKAALTDNKLKIDHTLNIPILGEFLTFLQGAPVTFNWERFLSDLLFGLIHWYQADWKLSSLMTSLAQMSYGQGIVKEVLSKFTSSPPVNAQMGQAEFATGLGIITVMITALGIGKMPGGKSTDQIINRFSRIGQCVRSGEIVYSWISEALKTAVDYIGLHWFGVESKQIPNITLFDEWCDEVTEMNCVEFENRLRNNDKMKNQIDALIVRGDKLMKTMDALHIPAGSRMRFNNCYTFLVKARALAGMSGIGHHTPRVGAEIIHIFGPTGQGKSEATNMLNARLLAEFGYQNVEDLHNLIYFRDASQERYDGYASAVEGLVIDDFGSRKDSQVNPNPEGLEIIRMNNTAVFQLPVADLAGKGNTFFRAKWVVLTSNAFSFRWESLTNGEAVARRIGLKFQQTVKKEFSKTVSIDGVDTQLVDPFRVEEAAKENPDVYANIWDFWLVDPTSSNEQPKLLRKEPLSFEEMATLVVNKVKETQKFGGRKLQHTVDYFKQCVNRVGGKVQEQRTETTKEGDAQIGENPVVSARYQGGDDMVLMMEDVSPEPLPWETDYRQTWTEFFRGVTRIDMNSLYLRPHVSGVKHKNECYDSSASKKELDALLRGRFVFVPNDRVNDFCDAFAEAVSAAEEQGSGERNLIFSMRFCKVYGNKLDFMSQVDRRHPLGWFWRSVVMNPVAALRCSAQQMMSWRPKTSLQDFFSKYLGWFKVAGLIIAGVVSFFVGKKISDIFLRPKVERWQCRRFMREQWHGSDKCSENCIMTNWTPDMARNLISWSSLIQQYDNAESAQDKTQGARRVNVESRQEQTKGPRTVNVETALDRKQTRQVLQNKDQRFVVIDGIAIELCGDHGECKQLLEQEVLECENGCEVAAYFGTAQMSMDQNASEVARSVAGNLYRLVLINGTSRRILGNGVVVSGRVMLTNYHICAYIQRHQDAILEVASVQTGIQEIPVKELNFTPHKTEVDRDVSLFELPRTFLLRKRIMNLFMTREDMCHHTTLNNGALVGFSSLTDWDAVSVQYAARPILSRDRFELRTEDEQRYVRDFYEYPIQSQPGDCGSVLLAYDPSVQRKICGIHMAGRPGPNPGIGAAVHQETVQELLGDLSWLKYAESFIDNTPLIATALGVNACSPGPEVEEIYQGKAFPGDYVPLGKAPALYVPTKTNIIPSGVKLGEPRTKPALLKRTKVGDQWLDPLEIARKKAFTRVVTLDDALVKRATNHYAATVLRNVDPKDQRILTIQQAIEGIENEECYLGVKRNTSPGFGWEKKGVGKRPWLGTDEYIVDNPEVLARVAGMLERCKNGQRTGTVWTDTLKDERRPIEKVDQGKTRLFAAGEMSYLILFRQYFQGFAAHMTRNRIQNESCIGINVYSMEWNELANQMRQLGPHVIAGDFSNYDGTLNAHLLWACLDLIEVFYDGTSTEEDRLVRRMLWLDIVHSVHIGSTGQGSEAVFYMWTHSQPSGCPITAILNSVYHSLVARYVFMLCARKYQPEMVGLSNFSKYVRLASYGDDDLYNISPRIVEWFNQVTMSEAFQLVGMTYTDETKTGELVPFRRLEDVAFLKRTFLWDGEEQRYLAPLSLDTILEMALWTKRGASLTEVKDTVEDAVRELSLHPRDTFDHYIGLFRKATVDWPVPVCLQTFDEYKEIRLATYVLGKNHQIRKGFQSPSKIYPSGGAESSL